ncbi:hypothetical protein L5515_008652 [Caenorhabditis briggsae]|uniref:NOT2/NOT3/NOT5 C-terminal domain-containing protein n=1 Tax=Caenorhabditis briggsae TaxID=6238 RepID=A0AAE9JL72_CAEBR|nr:hypothetical protein L5515_008652 [Caenorhabditis briggsae]
MVRRGSRTSGPSSVNNTTSSSGSSEAHWKSGRAHSVHSAETSLAKSGKSDSTDSSPASQQSSSPSVHKKGGAKVARSSSNWRGSRGGGTSGRSAIMDSKFMITSEDFPALPGVPGMRNSHGGTSHSTPSKYQKREREKDTGKHFNGDLAVADDSGISSSRGATPTEVVGNGRVTSRISKGDFDGKKKSSCGPLSVDSGKRKNGSPVKERPPRGSLKHSRFAQNQAVVVSSPKKKTIHANAANTAPSFMKLSKIGQKVPERRGGPRVHNHSPQSATSAENDKENNTPKKDTNHIVPSAPKIEQNVDILSEISREELKELPKDVDVVPDRPMKKMSAGNLANVANVPPYCIFHPSDVPKIILGPNGEMTNIPSTMLTDQFGMAAMLPILDIVKNRSVHANVASLTEEELREKVTNENIEMTSIGFDLNELGVPMKTQEPNPKKIWESFSGPFGTQPLLPTSMGLTYNQVPSVYYTGRTLQANFDMLLNIPEKFGVHELFYIFYNLPKEVWQLNAARELQYRGWRYNIKEKLWVLKKLGDREEFTPTPPQSAFTPSRPNQEDVMVGVFEIYDAEKARICSAELVLCRSDFEVPAWEQKVPDNYQRMLATVFSKEALWGPREDRKNFGFMQGISGIFPNMRVKGAANLTISKPTQPSERRLLSFVDSPDVTSNFESPFGSVQQPTTEDMHRQQQMYALLVQKMQMQSLQNQQQQLHQHLNMSNQPSTSSMSASNYFPN